MCGIFGYVGPRADAAEIVLEGLKILEYRGYDSWGVAVVPKDSGKIAVKKKAGKIGDANVKNLPEGHLSFGHTRWATHGGVTDENAHPHLGCEGKIAVIHNGIFENYEEYKNNLIEKGHKFVSETDTEVIVHLLEDYSKSMEFRDAVKKVFNLMEGLNAIIAINREEGEFVAARNGSPLCVGFGKDENFLASDAAALLPHTKKVYFLEDKDLVVVTEKEVAVTNVKTGEPVEMDIQTLEWEVSQGEKGDYPYFMLKEIHEQPRIIEEIARTGGDQAQKMADLIKESKNVYLVGCGSASYVCLAGTYLFSKIASKRAAAAIGSEFGYHLDFLNSESLILGISQSGETMDILESVKKAQEKGASIMALVNVLGSSLYRMADHKMLIGAGPEKGVASTKAVTSMLAHLILVAYALDGRLEQGKNVLLSAASAASYLLGEKSLNEIKNLADQLVDKNHIYVIGRGLSYPASLEMALKIKEISYIHAEGMPAGELKHGPLALVEEGTPCIAFLPNDETYGSNLAGAMEMRARGGHVIGISHKNHEVFDTFIKVPDAKEASIVTNAIVSQLLSYHLTTKKGLDPDMPRNLAKSVTVK